MYVDIANSEVISGEKKKEMVDVDVKVVVVLLLCLEVVPRNKFKHTSSFNHE